MQKEKGGFPIPDLNGSIMSTTPISSLGPSGSLKVGIRMLREASIIKSSPQLLESKNQDEEDEKVGKPCSIRVVPAATQNRFIWQRASLRCF